MKGEINKIRSWGYGCAVVLLLALPSAAQLQMGDNLRMNMSGDVGFTYSGDLNQGTSDHALGLSGNGTVTGSYYNPNFLNFNASPFYNRAQTDSTYGSLTNATGVSSNVNLFNGSRFPGTISYNRTFNGTGAFGVPGSDLGLAEHANTQGFGIGWSALLPGLPTLTANYGINNTDTDILGVQGNDTDASHLFNLLSTYRWDGFTMTGQFTHRHDNAVFAELLEENSGPVTSISSTNSYGATVEHALPFSGNFGVSWNHLGYNYQYEDSTSEKNSGGSQTLNGNAAFHPANNVGVSFNANYNDSLLGSIPQPILNTGAPVDLTSASTFHSFLVGTDVFYQVIKSFGIHADVAHQDQTFLGQTYSATQFGGSANFNFDHSLVKGLSFSVGAVDTAQQANNTGIGFVGNLNYNRKFWGWDLGANFAYAQNVQTVMLVYTTSSYSYLGSLRKRIGDRAYFMTGYSGSHSGITANSGTTSSAERVFASFLYKGNALNAYYNQSNGLAILTATGLVSVPTTLPTQVLVPGATTSYSSKGWGTSLSIMPIRRLSISAAFAKADGSTIDPALSIYTNNTLLNAVMYYRMRKIYVSGGYTRVQQSVGTPGSSPLMVTSYYIGFSRWFNFF